MAHKAQQTWLEWLREQLPEYFGADKRVLDCGSLDINGNNRWLWENPDYYGIDVQAGPNVNEVIRVHDFVRVSWARPYDVIISTEMLEHDEHYQASLRSMVKKLRDGGLLIFSCATTGRPEHGTSATTPSDSPATLDYYRNLEVEDIAAIPNFLNQFSTYRFFIEESHCDMYFYGIKIVSGGNNTADLRETIPSDHDGAALHLQPVR